MVAYVWLATAAMFLASSFALVLSRGDGSATLSIRFFFWNFEIRIHRLKKNKIQIHQ